MSHPKSITVLVADNHPLFRESLCDYLRSTPDLVAFAPVHGQEHVIGAVKDLAPHVLVLDLHLAGPDLPGLIRRISRLALGVRVLVLAADSDGAALYAAVAAGAAGVLTKQETGPAIGQAIRVLAADDAVLSPSLVPRLFSQVQTQSHQAIPRLSEREREVLLMSSDGLTVGEMSKHLHLSPGTVKTYLGHVYGKLGVRDRGAAVAEGMRRGVIS